MQHHDNDYMTRERSRRDERRGSSDHRRDERGAFFGSDRDDDRARDRDNRAPWATRSDDQYGERDPKYGSDVYRDGPPREETRRLIASNKVEGTPVYDPHGEKLGTIHNFMVDKYEGRVVYAVLKSSGGFLGLGERYYPLDWCDLTYDNRAQGYGVDFTEDDLDRRRSFDADGREIMERRHRHRGRHERDHSRW